MANSAIEYRENAKVKFSEMSTVKNHKINMQ